MDLSLNFCGGSVRGRLGSLTQLARHMGILISYVLGAFVDYEHIPCIVIVFPIIFLYLFYRLPNTPKYYLSTNQPEVRDQVEPEFSV